jgi:hypothetical protein
MYRKPPLLFVAVLMCFLSPDITFAAIGGNASISYSESESTIADVTTSTWRLDQNYRLGFDKRITQTITFLGNVDLTISDSKDGDRRESLFPLFVLSFSPPEFASQWYNLDFSFNRTQTAPSVGVGITTSNTSVSLDLPFKRWPPLSLSYSRSTVQDDLDPHRVDTVSDSISFRTDYQFEFLGTETSIGYTFSGRISEDKVNEFKSENTSHLVRTSFLRSFWEKKVAARANLGFSYEGRTTESDFYC